MARLRSEVLPLSVPVFLCVAAWAMLSALPAARAHHTPTPRPRVTLPPHTQRPPTPAPAAPTATAPSAPPVERTAEAAEAPAAAGVAAGEVIDFEAITIEGTWDCSDDDDNWYGGDSHAWHRWAYYYRREWQARRRAWLDARARRVNSTLAPGAAGAFAEEAPASPLCEVFPAACGTATRRAASRSSERTEATIATARRNGLRWTLSNGLVEATIDPSALCAVAITRHADGARDALPPLTIGTPDETPCTVTETAGPDTLSERGSVAVAIAWSGNGWTQRAVLSLADGAAGPEVSVSRTHERTTTLTNLTATELTWTLDGREVRVPVGHAARVHGA